MFYCLLKIYVKTLSAISQWDATIFSAASEKTKKQIKFKIMTIMQINKENARQVRCQDRQKKKR